MSSEEDEILELHERNTGVLSMHPEFDVKNKTDLGKAYTPGVAKIAKIIEKDPSKKDVYTMSGKLVALVTDGSAVLGLGNVGPGAGLPIVEGKCLLYKTFSGVDALPVAINQVNVDEFVQTLKNMAPTFAGIHLEDIKAPRCFEIQEKLEKELDLPIYHDDQQGTAIVVLAGLINAAKLVHKSLTNMSVVVNGAGASGLATAKLLAYVGMKKIVLVDKDGVIQINDKDESNNKYQKDFVNELGYEPNGQTLSDVIKDKDVFIGLSVNDVLSKEDVKNMAKDPIIFALANPKPEIMPDDAIDAGAAIVATGSSQYPNQVNNVLAFPGLFKALLENNVKKVTYDIQETVAKAIANVLGDKIDKDHIVPDVFNKDIVDTICQTVRNKVN
ncbi:MAG: NADP-dependent malic enzyme [Firmicutes bacterium]|uniref:NADP-dependent malic enzyme n=1 Tax=Candidatus Gallilactobacillus intestinavium TaxID=2840838 RepID=A0A9D9H4Y2_9LACO|nr:NADP-dependent malic enzyme [Candidatus Gallilactobacillus intestinavium]